MTMRLNRTDAFATFAVGIGVVVYALWLVEAALPGLGSARVVGALVLGLGWLASAVAVVPSFDELLRSSKAYLVVTSMLGLTALTVGSIVLVNASEAMLAVLVGTTVAMWALATIRHTLAARNTDALGPMAGQQVVDERELAGSGRPRGGTS